MSATYSQMFWEKGLWEREWEWEWENKCGEMLTFG